MKLTGIRIRRAIGAFTLTAAFAFVAMLSTPEVYAQQPSSSEQLNTLMLHRQEMSKRAVDETQRRRFEDGKSDSTFPSDMVYARKAGVVRALTPEEQEALKHNERGLQFFSKGKQDEAIKEYQSAIRSDPKLAAAHNNLGSALFAAGRFEEAVAAFRRACELDTDYGQAFFNLALVHIKLGHEREANETLDAALRAYISEGEAHLKARRFKEAEEAFRGMLQIDPEYTPALMRLGLVYNAAGRYEEAARNISRVAEREPGNAAAHETLAEALYGQQKYEEAATSAERALKFSPNSPDAHYLAGLARASLGQRDTALAHLASLRQLNAPDLAQQLSDFINKKAQAKR
ncbi:MAG TPA: tetratricopeptide repeat protein [Pyrinomonadaceae bacterium]|nr:tetratricopeptide repeat protein [Pyrinomonadaceae bacterium]